MLVKGVPMPQIIAICKEGRRSAIKRIADDIDKGNIVLFNGKWMKAEEREKHGTSKAGESAAKAAAKAAFGTLTFERPIKIV
jgi:hypothetical protein